MPNAEAALVQVLQIVGKLEADAFVLGERLAEGMAVAGVLDGDIVTAPRGAKPAHAVREAGGRQADLRVAETFAGLAENRSFGTRTSL